MSDLTHVELLWLEKRIENWIRFGHAAEEQILDRRRRILSFAPGSIFAFVRWISNDYGTVASRIDIIRAVASGQPCATVPYVRPACRANVAVGASDERCDRRSLGGLRDRGVPAIRYTGALDTRGHARRKRWQTANSIAKGCHGTDADYAGNMDRVAVSLPSRHRSL